MQGPHLGGLALAAMRFGTKVLCAGAVSVVIGSLAGCASSTDYARERLTADNIGDRVAEAQRDAGTFSFEWTEPGTSDGAELVTTGELEYADGELVALAITMEEDDQEYRLVDDTLYGRSGDDEFGELGESAKADLVKAWDWADVAESETTKAVREVGTESVDGVTATEYEIELADTTTRWWIDADDRLVKWANDEGETSATLTDYGDPVDISVPET